MEWNLKPSWKLHTFWIWMVRDGHGGGERVGKRRKWRDKGKWRKGGDGERGIREGYITGKEGNEKRRNYMNGILRTCRKGLEGSWEMEEKRRELWEQWRKGKKGRKGVSKGGKMSNNKRTKEKERIKGKIGERKLVKLKKKRKNSEKKED